MSDRCCNGCSAVVPMVGDGYCDTCRPAFRDVREALANRNAYRIWATGRAGAWKGPVPSVPPPAAIVFDWLDVVLAAHDAALQRAEAAERENARIRHITDADAGLGIDEALGRCGQCGEPFMLAEGCSGRTYLGEQFYHAECLANAVEYYWKEKAETAERERDRARGQWQRLRNEVHNWEFQDVTNAAELMAFLNMLDAEDQR